MATQEELILKQFGAARQGLQQRRKAGEQELEQNIKRQAAQTGLQGGAMFKAQEGLRRKFEEGFSGAEAELSGSEAAALRQAKADEEAKQFSRAEREASQQFGREERLGSQQFSAQEAEVGRQFGRGEREASQAFAAAESALGRQLTTSEREAIQQFQAEEAQRQRQYGTTEREAQQQFASGERAASEAFAGAQAQLGRDFTTQEREAVQAFQDVQASIGRTFAKDEREASQMFASAEAALGRQFTTEERQAVQAFQDQQRLGSQEFAAGQAAIERLQRENEFVRNMFMQYDQLSETSRQFDQQMGFNYRELQESSQANWINAMTAWKNAGMDSNWAARITGLLSSRGVTTPSTRRFESGQVAPNYGNRFQDYFSL